MTASVALAGYLSSVLITSTPSVALTDDTLNNPLADDQTFLEATAAHRYWDNTVLPVIQTELDAVQTITITGSPTGGTFTLTWGGHTTTAIQWNSSAAAMQTIIQATTGFGAGTALCTGGPLPATPINVEFAAALGFAAQATFTHTDSLTGGSSPAVVPSVAQVGQGWTTASASSYTVQYVGGQVKFNAPFLGTSIGVRASTGNYFPYATLAQCKNWEVAGSIDSIDVSTMVGVGGSAAKQYIPTLFGGTAKLARFWVDQTFLTFIEAGTLLVVSMVTPSNNRYEAYCFAKDLANKLDVKSTIDEDLTFQLSGVLAYF